ncbi:MAG: hypothetical protein HY226_00885 [Candidatus Vogelbacteria bacterium]|nr:hypothetical protein [Candidatus Vogelbacteria bacterium]
MKSILMRLLILVVIVSIPIYLIYKDHLLSKSAPASIPALIATTTPETTSTNTSRTGALLSNISTSILPIPNLDKKWQLPADYSDNIIRIMNFKISERTKDLKSNPDQFVSWLDLGILRKTVGDYNEAKNIWEYTASVWPDSLVSYHNLGDLYANYFKDNGKAEKNMKKVTQLDPHYIADYLSLNDLYRKMYGETGDKTGAVLLEGIKNNPDSVDLLMAIALHYKNVNNKDNAKKYYDLAIKVAENAKNDSLVKDIQAELNKI